MNKIKKFWGYLINPNSTEDDQARREYITRVVSVIMVAIFGLSFALVAAGWLAGHFIIQDVILITAIFLLSLVIFVINLYRLWRINCYLIPALIYFTGVYFSATLGLSILPALFYTTAILLASALLDQGGIWLFWALGSVSFLSIGYFVELPIIEDFLSTIIVIGTSFTGISILQSFVIAQMNKSIVQTRIYADDLRKYKDRLEITIEERTSELKQAQESLIRQERLAALGQLAGSVGHELRNPLGVISNTVYLLRHLLKNEGENIHEYLSILKTQISKADKIITDLLSLARIKSVNRRMVSIDAILSSVIAQHPAPANIRLHHKNIESISQVFVDPEQLEQILTNLIMNAYEAMPDGGTLSTLIQRNTATICLQIEDTGVGIPLDLQEHIFEPLYTTKATGLGLGLALTKKLVEANEGKITYTSQPGAGTTFYITLPCKDTAAVDERNLE